MMALKETIVRANQSASAQMADRDTPLLEDQWYVVAFGGEIGRSLLKRVILGKTLVMFRTEAGEPVALDDRCAHRSYPLSAGKLVGDTVQCGYHGLRFDPNGDCVEVPALKECPRGIAIKAYPLVERGPVVWAWMGSGEADLSRLPEQDWITRPGVTFGEAYLHLEGSYVRLHENLLDLTHLSFLHQATIGVPQVARTVPEIEIGEGRFGVSRELNPTTFPPIWIELTGISGENQGARKTRNDFISPGLHEIHAYFYDRTLSPEKRKTYNILDAHFPTPETNTSTHYFIVLSRDFATDRPDVTDFIRNQFIAAFNEDVAGLKVQESMLASTPRDELYEISLPTDRAAVAMRRYLKKLADEAAAATAS